MGKDFRCGPYVTDCHGPLNGVSWLGVLGQVELSRELGPRLLFSSLRFPGVLNRLQPYQLSCLVAWSTGPGHLSWESAIVSLHPGFSTGEHPLLFYPTVPVQHA